MSVDMDVTIALSELGQKRALEITGRGVKYELLTTLYENGTMTLGELSDEMDLDPDKVAMILKALDKKGYVRGLS